MKFVDDSDLYVDAVKDGVLPKTYYQTKPKVRFKTVGEKHRLTYKSEGLWDKVLKYPGSSAYLSAVEVTADAPFQRASALRKTFDLHADVLPQQDRARLLQLCKQIFLMSLLFKCWQYTKDKNLKDLHIPTEQLKELSKQQEKDFDRFILSKLNDNFVKSFKGACNAWAKITKKSIDWNSYIKGFDDLTVLTETLLKEISAGDPERLQEAQEIVMLYHSKAGYEGLLALKENLNV